MGLKFNPISGQFDLVDGGSQWETRTGAYDAFVNKTPDDTIIDVGLNQTTPYTVAGGITPNLNVVANNGNPGLNIMGISSHGSGSFFDLGSLMFFNRSRGTASAPTALQNGDYIGGLVFGGYGQGDYQLTLTGLIAISTDDWDVIPNSFKLAWVLDSTEIFSTDNTALTTVLQPFEFNTYTAINSAYSINNRLKINDPGTASSTAELMVTAANAARTPIVIQGFGSQVADIFQAQNDTGTNLFAISSSGAAVWGGDTNLYRHAANVLRTDDALEVTGVTYISDGSAGTPGIAFTSDPDLGMHRVTTNHGSLNAGGSSRIQWNTTEVVVNPGGLAANDFRVLGDTNTHLIFADVSADAVGINNNTPTAKLDVTGTGAYSGQLTVGNGNQTYNSQGYLLRSNNTYTLDFASAVSPVGYDFASTLVYNQDGFGFGSGLLFYAHPTIQNSSGSTRTIGPWIGYLSNPTYQANGGSLSGQAIDFAAQAIFNRINSGTTSFSNHYNYWAQGGTVDTGATVTNRYGFYYSDSGVINGTLTSSAAFTSHSLLGTNKTHVLLGTNTIPSGTWGIYQSSTEPNYFRNTPRVATTTSSASLTINSDACEQYTVTALAADLTINAPTGTPTDGQPLTIRIKDNATARALAWNAIFRQFDVTLPSTTTVSKTMYVSCRYNSADTKWDVLSVQEEI